jgi:glycosyltransferase involved in cell wall biosynthesis
MIKILFIIDKLEPAGTQTNLLEIAKGLDKTRFEVYVAVLQKGGSLEAEFRAARIPIFEFEIHKAYGIRAWKALRRLARIMKEKEIDVVQSHFLKADILGSFAAQWAGVEGIVMARRDEGFWMTRRQVLIARVFNRYATRMLANSHAVARAVMKIEKIKPECLHVIHNGIDDDRFRFQPENRKKIREEFQIKDSEIVVVTVANMRQIIKGYACLINAVAKVTAQFRNIRFIFVGDGVLKPEYEKQVSALKVRRFVNFAGSRRDVKAFLDAGDIFCLPSLTEGFSNAVLEAMACSKPVVAANVGGNPEAVEDGAEGFLVAPGSAGELAEKILALAADPGLRARMGEAGRKTLLEKFTLRKMIDNYQEFYTSLAGGKK